MLYRFRSGQSHTLRTGVERNRLPRADGDGQCAIETDVESAIVNRMGRLAREKKP